ncbi:pyridoxal phosphate-dependent aminotransferase [Streptomyces sp. NPDC060031]|uniref:pyridoxal phosphate-dependent aminotransferase n=1 Tax=Streptomyces sp. NPDC060031 TaxID=3347043 RepID=UPI0036AE1CAF
MLRLHANEHPQGPSAGVADALHALVPELHRYPVPSSALETAIAELYDVPLNRVLVGAGSAEIISLAWRAFTTPARAAFFHEPEFELYSILGDQCGTPALTRPWAPTEDLAKHLAGTSVGLVALSNPHNPTGATRPRQTIADLAGGLPDTTVVLNDEAYHDYADVDEDEPSLGALSELPNVLTTRTFSKIHGLAGLRIGYAVGNAGLIGALRSLQTPFSVSTAACTAALASLADPALAQERRALNRRNREALADALARRGFDVTPSQANFLFVRPPYGRPSWATDLLDRGVRVQPVGADLRVTVGTATEVATLIAAVDDVLAAAQTAHVGEQ